MGMQSVNLEHRRTEMEAMGLLWNDEWEVMGYYMSMQVILQYLYGYRLNEPTCYLFYEKLSKSKNIFFFFDRSNFMSLPKQNKQNPLMKRRLLQLGISTRRLYNTFNRHINRKSVKKLQATVILLSSMGTTNKL